MSRPPESLSIIVPVLDEAQQIGPALDALQAQRVAAARAFPGGIELVVVDGGSRDGTPLLCHGRVDRLVATHRGRGHQLNAGAAEAVGDVLLFLHADTRLPPGGLQAVAEALQQHPAAQWGRFDVRIDGGSAMFPVISTLMNLRSAWTGIATGDQAMFVRRSSYAAAGGFPDQPLMEDVELSKRLLRLPAGRPLRLRSKVTTSGRRWESRGVCKTIWLMWCLRWRYWRGTPAEQLAEDYR
ncbi:TIGR04283 family arsenosugar biosynthesis glycosyltransferase [Piscinibacter sakaiensis]|uniref:TIGR04283 family arsenosugar biosynthesis glycosyltransferase n=1 Tax=Piscinibacter sakaiensis TaxID=1547922 RepID=UPI003AAD091D